MARFPWLTLVRQFGVSEMTVRRDLAALEQEGKLVRVHGGAISSRRLANEYSFRVKEAHSVEAKRLIGETASELVLPMDIVFVDTGSTALAVAASARRNPRVMITSNLAAAMEMVGTNIRKYPVSGGELSPHSPDLYGEWTLQILSTVNVDVAFFGCDERSRNRFSRDPTRSCRRCPPDDVTIAAKVSAGRQHKVRQTGNVPGGAFGGVERGNHRSGIGRAIP